MKRLPFGVASTQGIFKKKVEKLIVDLDRVVAIFNDFLITGET